MKFTFHTDPGHGWLEVPMSTIFALGIQNKISSYSYRRGDTAYLEEDCDASLFLEAWKQAGHEFKLVEKNEPRGRSFIRGLPSYCV